jgi:4-amino-4-deoxy-L-arabinose transferase-like glycosyltransferase
LNEESSPPGCISRSQALAILGFAFLNFLIALFGDLKIEEAYYWNYSQHPDLSYFDHPPMVAWMIGASCRIFGDYSWAVRLPAVISYAVTTWLLSDLSCRAFGRRAADYSIALLATVPALSLYSSYILPDSPLMLFWSLGLWATWMLFHSEKEHWWWLIGLATGLGLDSKYSCLLIPLTAFLTAIWIGKPRLAFNLTMICSAALAIELFSPVILWNVATDFSSFRFQGGERMGQATGWLERVGGWAFQFGLFSPIAFLCIPACLRWSYRSRSELRHKILLTSCLPFLALMIYVSCRRLVQINWPIPGYLGLICLFSGWLAQKSPRIGPWILANALIFRLLLLILVVLPIGASNSADDIHQWSEFGQQALAIRAKMARPDKTFFAGPGYQAASELAFTTGLPHLTLSNNLFGERALAFDRWEDPMQFRHWDAVVANYAQPRSNGEWKDRNQLSLEKLQSHFETVGPVKTVIIERGGRPLRRYQYFECTGYTGPKITPR